MAGSMWARNGRNDLNDIRSERSSPAPASRKTSLLVRASSSADQTASGSSKPLTRSDKSRDDRRRLRDEDLDSIEGGHREEIRKSRTRDVTTDHRQKGNKRRARDEADSPDAENPQPVVLLRMMGQNSSHGSDNSLTKKKNEAKMKKYAEEISDEEVYTSSDESVPIVNTFVFRRKEPQRSASNERNDHQGRQEVRAEGMQEVRILGKPPSVPSTRQQPSPSPQKGPSEDEEMHLGASAVSDRDSPPRNTQPQLKQVTVDILQYPDGTCKVNCLPDEDYAAYSSLRNASKNKVEAPLVSSGLNVVDPNLIKPENVYPGIKFYRTLQTEHVKMGRLKIAARTVKPVETLRRYDVILTALTGSVVIKCPQFTLTSNGVPALKRCHLEEGQEVKIKVGLSYSIENWNDTEAVLLICMISDSGRKAPVHL